MTLLANSTMKTAVIMAAGMGTRFGSRTKLIPKGFIEVGGISMIKRSIQTLKSCGIERIIIGTGYHNEYYDELAHKYDGIECVFSPRFAETNSMYTLWNCRDILGVDDFILLESDIIYEQKAITALIEFPKSDVMLITPITKFQDQYYVESNSDGILTNCSINKHELNAKGELVGIHKISNKFYKLMCENYAKGLDMKLKLGYEYELLSMSQSVSPIYVLSMPNLLWYEIDDESDLLYAEKNILPKF
jgi:choline kinase